MHKPSGWHRRGLKRASLRRHALCAGVWRDRFRRILCGMHHLAMIVGSPLRIVREFGEASLEPLKLTNFVGTVRYPGQFGIFTRLGAILLRGEYPEPFCETV